MVRPDRGSLDPRHQLPFVPAGYLRLWIAHFLFSTAVVTRIVRARLAGLVLSSARAPPSGRIGAAATIMVDLTMVAIAVVAVVLRRGGESSSDVAATLTGN